MMVKTQGFNGTPPRCHHSSTKNASADIATSSSPASFGAPMMRSTIRPSTSNSRKRVIGRKLDLASCIIHRTFRPTSVQTASRRRGQSAGNAKLDQHLRLAQASRRGPRPSHASAPNWRTMKRRGSTPSDWLLPVPTPFVSPIRPRRVHLDASPNCARHRGHLEILQSRPGMHELLQSSGANASPQIHQSLAGLLQLNERALAAQALCCSGRCDAFWQRCTRFHTVLRDAAYSFCLV